MAPPISGHICRIDTSSLFASEPTNGSANSSLFQLRTNPYSVLRLLESTSEDKCTPGLLSARDFTAYEDDCLLGVSFRLLSIDTKASLITISASISKILRLLSFSSPIVVTYLNLPSNNLIQRSCAESADTLEQQRSRISAQHYNSYVQKSIWIRSASA